MPGPPPAPLSTGLASLPADPAPVALAPEPNHLPSTDPAPAT